MRVNISGLSSWRKVGAFGFREMSPFKEVRINQCDIPWAPWFRRDGPLVKMWGFKSRDMMRLLGESRVQMSTWSCF